MYEEAAGVPLLIVGSGPSRLSRKCETPVSHVDLFPFILNHFGIEAAHMQGRPGISPMSEEALQKIEERGVLSEYHATGSSAGIFMLRWKRWKLIHYVDQAPQLFDLQEDPEELRDLAAEPACQATLRDLHARLRNVCEPCEVDSRARSRQRDLVKEVGGREAILARGDIGYSPAPRMVGSP
jgi:choline-sulfatase